MLLTKHIPDIKITFIFEVEKEVLSIELDLTKGFIYINSFVSVERRCFGKRGT